MPQKYKKITSGWKRIGNTSSSERNSSWSMRSEEHTSELQSLAYLVCRLLLEKKKIVLPNCSEEHTSELQSLAYLVYHLVLDKNSATRCFARLDFDRWLADGADLLCVRSAVST